MLRSRWKIGICNCNDQWNPVVQGGTKSTGEGYRTPSSKVRCEAGCPIVLTGVHSNFDLANNHGNENGVIYCHTSVSIVGFEKLPLSIITPNTIGWSRLQNPTCLLNPHHFLPFSFVKLPTLWFLFPPDLGHFSFKTLPLDTSSCSCFAQIQQR